MRGNREIWSQEAPDASCLGDLEQPGTSLSLSFPICTMREEHDDIPKPFLICDWSKDGEGGVELCCGC